MPELTLGHVFLAIAAVELLFVLVFAARVRSAQLELPPDRRSPAVYVVLTAVVVSSLILAALAFILPEARIRLI